MQVTVKWIKDNISEVVQCGKCGSLNYIFNIKCCDKSCKADESYFLDDDWDREMEVEILEETHNDDTVLYI